MTYFSTALQFYIDSTELPQAFYYLPKTTKQILRYGNYLQSKILLSSLLQFKKTLKDGNWSKEYVCMVDGVFPDEETECNESIGTLVVSMGIQCVRPDGKPARSRFRKLWSDGKHSVLSVNLYTGRTHQIRVHAQFLGYPIVGDRIYNSSVWGPQKGKGAEYGKSYEELCDDVREAHRGSNWHEIVDPEYETRLEKMAGTENHTTMTAQIVQPTILFVPRDHFQLYLHCLKYSTEQWSYNTSMPTWAVNPNVR
ncbi:unnamed protein product [Strongylus vulgaris]|uniref:Pseudouridine synthase RsuA/RluA-like domain-containing protein n=1 Tax=Strongylus vulgaris TaxID=40348 RepID=A0A3P7LQC7_STRVU|nr:unnamed protein product [Strongylus vulgaris]